MKRRLKRIWFPVIVLILVALGIIGIGLNTEKKYAYKEEDASVQAEVVEDKPVSYAMETCYNGEDIPLILFHYPFQKTEDGYMKNKEYIKEISKYQRDQIYSVAENYVNLVFNNRHTYIEKRQDEFKQNVLNCYADNKGMFTSFGETSLEDNISDLIEWYIDNKVDMEATFHSDKSLIYKDYYVYTILRGAIILNCFSETGANDFDELFGFPLKNGNTFSMIIEFKIMPEDNTIAGLQILDVIEGDIYD